MDLFLVMVAMCICLPGVADCLKTSRAPLITKTDGIARIPLSKKCIALFDFIIIHVFGHHTQLIVVEHGKEWNIHYNINKFG